MTQTIIKVPATGGSSFDPTDIVITDNTSGAFLIKDDAGSPTEYMRIDTTNSSEKMTFLVPKSASNDQIIFGSPAHNYLKLGHHSSSPLGASFAFVSQGGTNVNFGYNAHDSGGIEFKTATNRHCDVRLESGASFHIKDPNTNIFTVDQDANATFTLDSSSTCNFTVVDDAGSPIEYIKVDTTPSARDIRMKTGAANQIFTMQEGSGTGKFFQIRNGAYNQIYMQSDNLFGILAEQLTHTMYANGFFKGVSSDGGDVFKFTDDSNITFTLDSGSTCNFKVVDDAGSPTTYIDVERGSTEKVKIPIIGLETIRTASGGGVFIASLSSTTGMSMNNFPINYSNTLLTFDQTADGTTSAQSIKPGLTVVYSSSASGAATSSGITLQLGAGVPADGTTSPQYLVMHNQNSTHSAKFILDGSGFYNGHEVATSGSDAADLIGSGFTLAAGKFAVFSIIACRVTNTGDHYFYAVSLHTKT